MKNGQTFVTMDKIWSFNNCHTIFLFSSKYDIEYNKLCQSNQGQCLEISREKSIRQLFREVKHSWSCMLMVIKKTCFQTVTLFLQRILKDQKLVLSSVFSHLVFSLIIPFFTWECGKLLYGKPFNIHDKLHKKAGTFKISQAFTSCINLSLKFLNLLASTSRYTVALTMMW